MKININKNESFLNDYLNHSRFTSIRDSLKNEGDRILFETSFVDATKDKPDLNAEELNMYISLCESYVISKQLMVRMESCNNSILEASEWEIPSVTNLMISLHKLVADCLREYDACQTRMMRITESLKSKRKEKLEEKTKTNKSLRKLVEEWRRKDEKHELAKMAENIDERVERDRFSDTTGYFSLKKMNEVTIPSGGKTSIEFVGDPSAAYILAIDPNYNDSESADNFAMCLLKMDDEGRCGTVVHNYALSKSSPLKRNQYLTYLLGGFNIVSIIVDAAGGVKYLENANLNYRNLDVFAQSFDSEWIREANENLYTLFDQGRLRFASLPSDFDYTHFGGISHLHFAKNVPFFDHSEFENGQRKKLFKHQGELMNQLKRECSLIEVTQSVSGTLRFDLPFELLKDKSNPNRPRKDSYTALLLAAWAMKQYFKNN